MITAIEKMSKPEFDKLKIEFHNNKPFNYVVIDNFLDEESALKIAEEFPNFTDDIWYDYNNPLELKKASNNWNIFKKTTYKFFTKVMSQSFTELMSNLLNTELIPDIGLHGGGLHTHGNGGKLNHHLDYSIHPKLDLQRKVNIILYINPKWKSEYGGSLGFWSHNNESDQPDKLIKEYDCIFNRAIIFDTTQNSWHGISKPVKNDIGLTRNSLASYYLAEPTESADKRMKVKFAPTHNQKGDLKIEELIRQRQSMKGFKASYKTNF